MYNIKHSQTTLFAFPVPPLLSTVISSLALFVQRYPLFHVAFLDVLPQSNDLGLHFSTINLLGSGTGTRMSLLKRSSSFGISNQTEPAHCSSETGRTLK